MPGSGKHRRSISIARPVYEALKARCDAANLPLAAVVEHILRSMLGMPPNERPSSRPDPAKLTIRRNARKAEHLRIQRQAEIKIARGKILANSYLLALQDHGGDVVDAAMNELLAERLAQRERDVTPVR